MGVATHLLAKKTRILNKVTLVLLCFSALLWISSSLLRFWIIPSVVHEKVAKQSVLLNGSRMIQKWKDPKYKMQFKVWVFSVRNPDDVLKGSIPEVRESGPYVFDKKIHHEILHAGNGTVKFKRRSLFYFNEEESCATCILGNRIWIPNLMYQKFVEVASRPTMKAAATTLLAQTPFLELQVGDLLFNGYKDPFLENFCGVPFVNVICETVFDLPERIGLFYGYNDSYIEGEYEIKDGTSNVKERGEMISWNGMPHLQDFWWSSDEARRLKGTEGTLFHPFIEKSETLWTFANQLCRSIALIFEKELVYREIPVYRFTVPPEDFDTNLPDNTGFCNVNHKLMYEHQRTQEKGCYPRGLFSLTKCMKNQPPIVISMPNFNFAPQEVRDSVKGLNATNNDTDRILVDVEPTLGIALRAYRRVQINAEFWEGKDILVPSYHRTQRSTLIPLAIVHEDSEADDDTYEMIMQELIIAQNIAYGACTLLCVFAGATAIGAFAYAAHSIGIFELIWPSTRRTPSKATLGRLSRDSVATTES